MMKKTTRFLAAALLFLPNLFAGFFLFAPVASADTTYNPSYLISDNVFSDTSTMGVTDIQNFLVSKNSGLKNYSDVENCDPIINPDPYSSTYYAHCGASVSAATIIYDAGRAYGVNPRVILATLQKEQSLITSPSPTQSQINCAMGYNSCSRYVGFYTQVDYATWQFRTYVELMNGRSWWGYAPSSYPCKNGHDADPNNNLYSTGLYPGRTVTFYNSGGSARTVTLGSSATAALYCYTPYVGPFSETGYSGSYNFVVAFEQWFGSMASPCYNDTNVVGAKTGANIIAYRPTGGSASVYSLILPNNTGSGCVEDHTLSSPAAQSWISHMATGMRATDPANGKLLAFKPAKGSADTLLYVTYGNVEAHEFSPNLQTFPGFYDVPTNLSGISANSGTFVAGDFLGRGYDQLAFILYSGNSGKVEVHLFDPTLQRAIGFYDVPTNLSGISANSGTFVAGDFLGRGYDQLAFILYSGNSGKVEVHLFDPTLQRAIGFYDVPTNLSGISANSGTFVAGDFLGRGYDQLAFILYSGNSGKVEVHLFDKTLENGVGFYDAPTAIAGFDPTQ